jgi:hypothetical protein
MSKQPKHTPGPWAYNILPLKSYHKVPEISIYNADGHEFIRQSYDTYSDQAMLSEGDACLIAAAPEMLEALELAQKFMLGVEYNDLKQGEAGNTYNAICAAIAKAKGEQP